MQPPSFANIPLADLTSAPSVPRDFHDTALEIRPKKLNYIIEQSRIALSFSKLQTLRDCPRKFQCKELGSAGEYTPSIDTAYGHAFATGVQHLFITEGDLPRAMLAALDAWDYPYFTDPWGQKADKSFWACINSLQRYHETQFPILHNEYGIAVLDGKPAVELFAYVKVGQGYSYQVHIDLVLQSRWTGALVVAELKTSGMMQQAANWQNSLQTLGYYTLLSAIAARAGLQVDAEIMYIVQQTGKLLKPEDNYGFHTFHFVKEQIAHGDFMQDLAMHCTILDLYIENAYFPKYGHNCVAYGRPCSYFGSCDHLPSRQHGAVQTAAAHYEVQDLTSADYVLEFEEIVNLLKPREEN
jgi:hypothetical protein